MNFQYLKNIRSKQAQLLTKEKFYELIASDAVSVNVNLARTCLREGNKEGYQKAKSLLPSVMWVGYDAKNGTSRKAEDLTPTQYFIVDLDHVEASPPALPRREGADSDLTFSLNDFAQQIVEKMAAEEYDYKIRIVHVTPSGEGLRFVVKATQPELHTVKENMEWFVNELVRVTGHEELGACFDTVCKDFSRQSFLVSKDDFVLIDDNIFNEDDDFKPITSAYTEQNKKESEQEERNTQSVKSEETDYTLSEYRGFKLTDIAAKYVEVKGTPEVGERHNFYNDMVKNFRTICNNNYRMVHAVLPRFGNSYEETLSQCKSICKTNSMSKIPREFFFFLLDNGFYPRKDSESDADLKAYLEQEDENEDEEGKKKSKKTKIPAMPPVFREFCSAAPDDFVLPTVNALMPIMGTLTSYLHTYDWDEKDISTTFFNVVYAPASSGKSYINRLMSLFSKLEQRDEIASMREQIYLTASTSKGANEREPDDPHVSVRIMEAINSQPEFLTKMRDNKGYHMFTCSEEVDTFAKGTKAGGSDKSDMFRIAWDNGKYGQQFKSKTTFKGKVKLFYNILLTGTPMQVKRYYSNVEDGMVTRVSFCEIENQEFAERPVWKKMNKKQQITIDKFIERTDRNTYKEPLDFSVEEATEIDDKNFVTDVPWRYNYRPYQYVDMSWAFKFIDKWVQEKRVVALRSVDNAMDTFRRRVGQKGLRLALLCMGCWDLVRDKEKKVIQDFVLWWMEQDLEQSLRLFGEQYNTMVNDSKNIKSAKNNASLFDSLPEKFEKSDVVAKALQMGIKTPARKVIYKWMSENIVEKVEFGIWKKLKT